MNIFAPLLCHQTALSDRELKPLSMLFKATRLDSFAKNVNFTRTFSHLTLWIEDLYWPNWSWWLLEQWHFRWVLFYVFVALVASANLQSKRKTWIQKEQLTVYEFIHHTKRSVAGFFGLLVWGTLRADSLVLWDFFTIDLHNYCVINVNKQNPSQPKIKKSWIIII